MKLFAAAESIAVTGSLLARTLLALLLCSVISAFQFAQGPPDPYAQAESLIRSRHWDEGLSILATLLRQEPRNLKALNLAGLAMIGKGDPQHADEYFTKAIAVSAAFAPALKNLSISEFNAHQDSEAEKHLLAAQKLTPDDPAISLYLGEVHYRNQQYQLASKELARAPDFLSRSPAASAHLAISYLITSEQQKAVEVLDTLPSGEIESKTRFELAVALDQAGLPQRAVPYLEALHEQFQDSIEIAFDLVVADFEAKRFSQAIAAAKDLIARGHETSELDNLLAQAYEGDSSPQLALDAYRRAIALGPNDEENYVDLVSLCIHQHALQAGAAVIEAAIKERPKSYRLVFMRGLIHAMAGEMDLAESDFKLSEQLAPNNDLGTIGLGDSYMESGHSAEALTVLRKRLHDEPNDATLLYLLGESLLRTGALPLSPAYVEAQTVLERSTKLNAGLCLPHISLGTIYLDEGRNQDAAGEFEKARSIDPTERSTYSHLAVAYKRLSQPEKSREALGALKNILNQQQQNAIDQMKTAPAGPQ